MKTLILYLAVAAAGAVGSVLRLLVGTMVGKRSAADFPVGTFIINISGSLLLGWFYAYAVNRASISGTVKTAIGVGFVGAYTTFSTYMYESVELMQQGAWIKAGANLFGSVAMGLIAVYLGGRLAGN